MDWDKAKAVGLGAANNLLFGIPEIISAKAPTDIFKEYKQKYSNEYTTGDTMATIGGAIIPGAGLLKAGKALKAAKAAKAIDTAGDLTRSEKIAKMLGAMTDEIKATKPTKAFEVSKLIEDAPKPINWKLGDPSVGLPIEFDENIKDAFHIEHGPNGLVWKASPTYKGRSDYMGTRLGRKANEFFSPLAEDEYIRVAHDPKDYDYAKSGTLRESINHATGQSEGGISVAKYPEFKGKVAYYLKGNKIGIGTDGEPILDPKTIKVVSKPMKYEDILQDLANRMEPIAKKYGMDARTLKAMMANLYLKRDW